MKIYSFISKFVLAICLMFMSTVTKAQLDIDIDLGKREWYEDPKVWVGVAVFLLVLAFIARGKRK